jgi:hypothetical protein
MAPKVSKKTVSETKVETPIVVSTESSIEIIKQEWHAIIKEITSTVDKLSELEKKRDELVSKLWNIMNKNPTEHIVEEEPVEEKKSSVKTTKSKTPVKKTDNIIDDSENADSVKPKSKAKVVKAEPKPEPESEDEKPAEKPAVKAKISTKPKPKAETKTETKVETKAQPKVDVKKAPASGKKISAPVKGTPKPKIDEDSEDEKARPVMNDSSSESDVDSLSSVSSESEASGNDD